MAKARDDNTVALVEKIRASGLTIYDAAEKMGLLLEDAAIEAVLEAGLTGISVAGMPNRSRSKFVKSRACEILGYPVPASFKRVTPRLPGQRLDIHVQKANNFQPCNITSIAVDQRYAFVIVNAMNVICRVRVLSGSTLSHCDTRGTVTYKYQAKARTKPADCVLASAVDTERVRAAIGLTITPAESNRNAESGVVRTEKLLPIAKLYDAVRSLRGTRLPNPGAEQERSRGALLHAEVCRLIHNDPDDCGQLPDIRSQLLEVKLQLSPTIDLGKWLPTSEEPVESVPGFRHCDLRYAVCYASPHAREIEIESIVLVTGRDFFSFFKQFGGRERNAKRQIRLPRELFL